MITRRTLLKGVGAAVGGGVLTGLYTWQIEPHWLQITHRDLPISGLPKELDGSVLAQLSDIHIGPIVSSDYVLKTFKRIAELAPDFVVMTGDWITYRDASQFDELSRLLPYFPRGKVGTVSILGNHEYGYQWRMPAVADEVVKRVRDAGITLLRNEAVTLQGLHVVGLDDYWGPFFDPAPIMKEANVPGTLVLSHNPDSLDQPGWNGYQGWVLSGHTHGGQCKPPFLPPPMLPVDNKRYTAGEIDVGDGRKVYISRGVGHVMKVRFNVRPEVTMFTLRVG